MLAALALWMVDVQLRAGDRLDDAITGTANVERLNGLVFAVVMDSRGVYMAQDKTALERFAKGVGSHLAKMRGIIVASASRDLGAQADTVRQAVRRFVEAVRAA